jgi:hypothetical protein
MNTATGNQETIATTTTKMVVCKKCTSFRSFPVPTSMHIDASRLSNTLTPTHQLHRSLMARCSIHPLSAAISTPPTATASSWSFALCNKKCSFLFFQAARMDCVQATAWTVTRGKDMELSLSLQVPCDLHLFATLISIPHFGRINTFFIPARMPRRGDGGRHGVVSLFAGPT